MGSICYIEKDPSKWRVWQTDMQLKEEFGGEKLLKVVFGTFDDHDFSELEIYMRPSVYEKLLKKEYEVATESKWKQCLVIIDKERRKVPPVGAFVY